MDKELGTTRLHASSLQSIPSPLPPPYPFTHKRQFVPMPLLFNSRRELELHLTAGAKDCLYYPYGGARVLPTHKFANL
jgi:hypothetical protein